jgi:hypothetical protein
LGRGEAPGEGAGSAPGPARPWPRPLRPQRPGAAKPWSPIAGLRTQRLRAGRTKRRRRRRLRPGTHRASDPPGLCLGRGRSSGRRGAPRAQNAAPGGADRGALRRWEAWSPARGPSGLVCVKGRPRALPGARPVAARGRERRPERSSRRRRRKRRDARRRSGDPGPPARSPAPAAEPLAGGRDAPRLPHFGRSAVLSQPVQHLRRVRRAHGRRGRHGAVAAVRPLAHRLQGPAAQPSGRVALGRGLRPGAGAARRRPPVPAAAQSLPRLHRPQGHQLPATDVPGEGPDVAGGAPELWRLRRGAREPERRGRRGGRPGHCGWGDRTGTSAGGWREWGER